MKTHTALVMFLVIGGLSLRLFVRESKSDKRTTISEPTTSEPKEVPAARSTPPVPQTTPPTDGGGYLEASLLVRSGRYEAAAAVLERHLSTYSRDERALEEMGRLLTRHLSDPAKAVSYLLRAIEVNPESTRALSELVLAYHRQNEPTLAEAKLNELLRSHPSSAGIHETLGGIHASRGELRRARVLLERAAALSPVPSVPLTTLAQAYAAQGANGKAVETYRRVITGHRGAISRAASEPQKEAIEMEMAMTQMELAEVLIAQRKLEDAEALLYEVRSRHAEAPTDRMLQRIAMLRR